MPQQMIQPFFFRQPSPVAVALDANFTELYAGSLTPEQVPQGVGDGIANDTAGFVAAYATGRRVVPIKGKKYRVDLFNTDGAALSPTATQNTYWTRALLPIEPYYQYRARRLPMCLSGAVADTTPNGLLLGNSIPAGTGTSASGYTLAAALQFRLQQAFSRGAYSDWAVPLRAIGGTTAATAAMMVANAKTFAVGPNVADNTYAVVVCTRNDRNLLNAASPLTGTALYAQLLDMVYGGLVARGIDPICVIENPSVDVATGDILDDEIFKRYRETHISIAGKWGASVVDAWRYFYDLKDLYGIDLRSFMAAADSIHPNDYGHLISWDMVVQMLLTGTPQQAALGNFESSEYTAALYDFTPTAQTGGIVLTDTGLAVNTCRKLMLSEAGNQMAYSLTAAQTLTFIPDFPITGILVEFAMGSTGTIAVLAGGTVQQSAISAVNAGPGGFVFPVRYFAGLGAGLHTRASVVIRADTGNPRITGIAYICHAPVSVVDIPAWTQVGTWSNSTLAVGAWSGSGAGGISSATIGDTASLEFTGSIFSLRYSIGPAFGAFSYSVDGAAPVAVDCYNASAVLAPADLKIPVADGTHSVVITITAKNASASANTVVLGAVRIGTKNPAAEQIVHLAAGANTLMTKYRRLRKAGSAVVTYDGATVTAPAVTSVYASL